MLLVQIESVCVCTCPVGLEGFAVGLIVGCCVGCVDGCLVGCDVG